MKCRIHQYADKWRANARGYPDSMLLQIHEVACEHAVDTGLPPEKRYDWFIWRNMVRQELHRRGVALGT